MVYQMASLCCTGYTTRCGHTKIRRWMSRFHFRTAYATTVGLPGSAETYPFASDRHHRFILEGICDLQRQLERRGNPYAIHLERRNQHDPQLQYLINRAAVVVTDEMPVQPMRGWIDKLGSIAETTVLAVDTACVVPMQVVGRAYNRSCLQFRKATVSGYQHRISREWSEIEIQHGNAEIELPVSRPVLTEQTIGSLISKCDIDHSIGPVPHTRGGSAAGYARWDQFKRDGLKAYARHRNDPLADATSRLSPYLHFGMVSPLRIAREAAAMQSAGSEKFLDELLIWRELRIVSVFSTAITIA